MGVRITPDAPTKSERLYMARIFERDVNQDFQISPGVRAILDEKVLMPKITFFGSSVDIAIQHYDRNTARWVTIANAMLQGDVSFFIGDEFILSGNLWVHSDWRRQGLASVLHDIKKELILYCAPSTFITEPRMLASVRNENLPQQKMLTKQGWKLITSTDVHGLWEYRFPKKD